MWEKNNFKKNVTARIYIVEHKMKNYFTKKKNYKQNIYLLCVYFLNVVFLIFIFCLMNQFLAQTKIIKIY